MRRILFSGLVAALLLAIPMAASGHHPGTWGHQVEYLTAPLAYDPDFDNEIGHSFDLWCEYEDNPEWEILYSDIDLLFKDLGSQFYVVDLPAGDYRLAFECDDSIENLDMYITLDDGVVSVNYNRPLTLKPKSNMHWPSCFSRCPVISPLWWPWLSCITVHPSRHYWGWSWCGQSAFLDDARNEGDMPYIRFFRKGCGGTVGEVTESDRNPYIDFTIKPCPKKPRIRIVIEAHPYKFASIEDREAWFGLMILENLAPGDLHLYRGPDPFEVDQ